MKSEICKQWKHHSTVEGFHHDFQQAETIVSYEST